jgi:hypothetical protein
VADVRTHAAFVREEEWKPLLDAVAADYRDHPALAGYYLIDEPHAGMFEKLGAMSAYLREVDPDHFSYVNLFPNYAPPDFLRTDTYREYVERYVAEVQPPFICYDNYHFLNPELVRGGEVFASEEERRLFDIAHATGPRETLFFENLDIVRDVARENGLPFMVIVLLVEHGPYRELGEADLRWEAFQCLAHGASGVSYFSYWAPPYEENWRFRGAALTFEGERTPRYDAVKRVNRDLRVYGNALLGRELLSVTRVSEETPFKPAGELQRVEGGAVTVGVFTGGYALLANRSPYESIEVTVEAEKDKALQMLQSETGGLGSLGEAGQPIALKLGPGEGALLVVSQSKAGQ